MTDQRADRPTLFYRCCRKLLACAFTLLYRYRTSGEEHVPATGAALIVANHGSFLDPPLVGAVVRRRPVHFVARASLFKWPLGPIIRALNAIPLEDNAGDLRAIRRVIDHLKQGEVVLIFPEGARTHDGRLQPFRDGVRLITRKAGCPVIPAAVEGAFETWPRSRSLPRLFGCRVSVRYGKAIPADELTGPDANRRLEELIDAMRLDLRREMRAATNGRFPPVNAADRPLHDQATRDLD